MKKLITEDLQEGFEKLMGERITVFCCRYIYTGELVGVDDEFIKISNGGIVFETGEFDKTDWSDYQKFPNDFYIMKGSIEHFGIFKV